MLAFSYYYNYKLIIATVQRQRLKNIGSPRTVFKSTEVYYKSKYSIKYKNVWVNKSTNTLIPGYTS